MGYIAKVEVHNLRLLSKLRIELGARLNLVYGDNGAGKTSFLEALSLISRGCGAAPQLRDVLGPNGDSWSVTARVESTPGVAARIHYVAYGHGKRVQKINALAARNSELAQSLPLASLAPAQHALLSESASTRMRMVDWGMFHVEPLFLGAWREYRRALKQRNALLRQGVSGDGIRIWSEAVARRGEALAALRARRISEWNRAFENELATLQGDGKWTAAWKRGWDADTGLFDVLCEAEAGDLRAGTTRHGPHRADWMVSRDGVAARKRASRGEEKVAAIALLVTLAQEVQRVAGRCPVLLFDDLSAELSTVTRSRVVERLSILGGQVVATTHEKPQGTEAERFACMFHVEHGCISRC